MAPEFSGERKADRFAQARVENCFIVISDKAPKIECTVRNVSETGAALQVSTTVGIPQNFIVIMDGVRRHCRVQWRTDTKIGVMFE